MAKKKELDKLALDMIRRKADGYGCHYGAWKAMQERPVEIKPKDGEVPDGWLVCQHCGKAFKPKSHRPQKYCDSVCQYDSVKERQREKNRERSREYRQKKKEEERKLRNESCTG